MISHPVTAKEFQLAHGPEYFEDIGNMGVSPDVLARIQRQISHTVKLIKSGFLGVACAETKYGPEYIPYNIGYNPPPKAWDDSFLFTTPSLSSSAMVNITIRRHHLDLAINDDVAFLNGSLFERPVHGWTDDMAKNQSVLIGSRALGLTPKIAFHNNNEWMRIYIVWETPEKNIIPSSSVIWLMYEKYTPVEVLGRIRKISDMLGGTARCLRRTKEKIDDPSYNIFLDGPKIINMDLNGGLAAWGANDPVEWIDGMYGKGAAAKALNELNKIVLDKVVKMPFENIIDFL